MLRFAAGFTTALIVQLLVSTTPDHALENLKSWQVLLMKGVPQ